MAPHAPYTCDDDFPCAARDRADELGVGIHIHVAETRDQTAAHVKKRGVTPIRLLDDLSPSLPEPAHKVGATEEDIRLKADRPAAVAYCSEDLSKLMMGIAPIVAMRKAGVTVGLGTDGAVSNNTLDIWRACDRWP